MEHIQFIHFALYIFQMTKNNKNLSGSCIFLKFQSDRGSGVLLYAVGSIDVGGGVSGQHHSHVIASVHQGTVKASVAFGDDILEQTMGVSVDDNR